MISFKELFLDVLNKTALFEMAFDKKTMENKIRGLEKPINLHLIKLLRYKDPENKQKHINDIMTWLSDIQDLDFLKKNKKFSKDTYYKLLFEEPITDGGNTQYLKNLERYTLKSYLSLPIIRSEKETIMELEQLHNKISSLLSRNEIFDMEFDLMILQ